MGQADTVLDPVLNRAAKARIIRNGKAEDRNGVTGISILRHRIFHQNTPA